MTDSRPEIEMPKTPCKRYMAGYKAGVAFKGLSGWELEDKDFGKGWKKGREDNHTAYLAACSMYGEIPSFVTIQSELSPTT